MATAIQIQQVMHSALSNMPDEQASLLPILHEIQDKLGYVPKDCVPAIAEHLHLSRAEVHGVITFYHHFRQSPPAKHVLRVCRAEACQSMGGNELAAHATQSLATEFHGDTADGAITLEPVYCLGNCACAPSVMVGDTVHGRVSPERFDDIVAGLRSGT